MSLTSQTIWGFFWLAGGKGSKAVLQLGILAALARLLSPSEFGLMAMAMIIVNFSDIFADVGLGPAITQKKELSEEDIRTGFSFSIILGILLIIIVWILAPGVASFFNNDKISPILRAVSPILFLKSLSSTATGLLFRHLNYKKVATIELVSYTLGYGAVGILLAWLGFGVWALVIAVNSQALFASVLKILAANHPKKPLVNSHSLKELLIFGGGYSLSKIFSYMGRIGDKIVIGRILGADALGLYDRAYYLVRFLSTLVGEIIDKVLFSPIARKQDNEALIAKVYWDLVYVTSFLLIPASLFLFNNAGEVVILILGNQWVEATTPAKLMSLCLFLFIGTRIGSTLAKAMGDVYRRAARNLIYALMIILGSYFGAAWGINGVATAVLIGVSINYIMAFMQVKKLTKIPLGKIFSAHILGLSCGISYALLSHIINVNLFIDLLILSLVVMTAMFFFKKEILNKLSLEILNTKLFPAKDVKQEESP